MNHRFAWEHAVGAVGLGLFVFGQVQGLVYAPVDAHMGDVSRILYVHVPAAWVALLAFTVTFVGALGALWSGRPGWDWLVEASCEVGIVNGTLLLILGSLFARPTWGVWWDWDPRLTSSAVMLLTFVGVMLLRTLVDDPERRALWSAVASVVAYVNIPVTYMSVRWWRSLHQVQSTSDSMGGGIRTALWVNALAFMLVMVWMIAQRWRISAARARAAAPPPLPPAVEPTRSLP